MRLCNYLNISDPSTSLFRSSSINLVEKTTDNINKLNSIGNVDESIELLLQRANKELKSVYRGKMVFDLCIEEQGSIPDRVKMNESNKEKVKEMWYSLNDELSVIQSNFELYLSNIK